MADTSQSTANAIQITLVGGALADSGTTTASNDGTTETQTGNASPALSVLGGQTVITAGVLGQVSRAFNDGSAAACAGAVGAGGSITVGNTGTCIADNGAGVTLTLGTAGLASIALVADAVYGNCNATSAPTATGAATLVNARITSTILGISTTLLSLPANPAPNTGLNIPGLLNVTLNAQENPAADQISVTALNISALAGTLASLTVGNVTCGPDAASAPAPSIPLKGLPIALGMAGLLAGCVLLVRRLRTATV
jgi:hypothetical protein